jgi:hypothetical protein
MKIELKGAPGVRAELIGYPWRNRKKYGPPFFRLETSDGVYLSVPKYRELLKLQKMISICIRHEREADPKKRRRAKA